ncbi:uncharacterized protein HaLaN_19287 [Haematococcus lacustris]|uniref:Uncharacterized protein n=1 Tax=Haematococcus lacustris TaxID=44745 RepID=A0A699ZIU8_HAELA|nr:uncharacterized protein HaLaN_19287 [Haematococcus lacustris]
MVLQNTSGFERRQCELEKRREILRQAREKAEQPGSAAAPAVADAEDTADESDASSRRLELPRNLKATDLYEEQAAKALKAPLANPLESSPLNFSLPAMPEKLSDIKTPVTAKAGKRRGPLPLPVAQLLELGLMAGFVAAITKYNDQTTKVADAVWKVIVAAYTKLESLTAAKTA